MLELLEKETLDKADVAKVFEPVRRREPREVWLSSARRYVSERGPVLTAKELEKASKLRKNGHVNGHDEGSSMGVTEPTDVPDSPLPGEG